MSALEEVAAPVVTAFIASGGLVSAWAWWFDHREKARLKADATKESENVKQRKLDDKWFEEAAQAYQRVDKECRDCIDRLNVLSHRFYKLISALDDMCDMSDNGTIRTQDLRQAVRTARQEP